MSVATLRSEPKTGRDRGAPPPAALARADGAAELGLVERDGVTRIGHLYQHDPCRVLFPRAAPAAPLEAVFVTVSGGIAGGDRLRFAVEAGARTRVSATTQAAEKIYRSTGAVSRIDIALGAGPGAALEWMPQETILFDGARLRRTTVVDLAADARLIAAEIVVFGRIARGERFARGLLHDAWRVRRDGRLVWADALRLDGDVAAVVDRPASFGSAAALATVIYAGPDAAAHLEAARAMLAAAEGGLRTGASCIGEVLVARMFGPRPQDVRRCHAAFWSAFRAAALGFPAALPRIWTT